MVVAADETTEVEALGRAMQSQIVSDMASTLVRVGSGRRVSSSGTARRWLQPLAVAACRGLGE